MLRRLDELLHRGVALGATLNELGVDLPLPLAEERLAIRTRGFERMLGLRERVLLLLQAARKLETLVRRLEIGEPAAVAQIVELVADVLDLAHDLQLAAVVLDVGLSLVHGRLVFRDLGVEAAQALVALRMVLDPERLLHRGISWRKICGHDVASFMLGLEPADLR